MEYIKKVDLLNKAVEVEYLNRPRLMVSVATIGKMPSTEAVPMEYHNKVCEEMARRHQAEILELTADRPSDPHNITYINALKNRIRELEAKRPQGEWKEVPPNAWEFNGIIQWRECSVCKCRSMFISNYCPHCGAHMKGADDEER